VPCSETQGKQSARHFSLAHRRDEPLAKLMAGNGVSQKRTKKLKRLVCPWKVEIDVKENSGPEPAPEK
jgi:hypothetical protein